jgi:hypothetical protein
MVINWPMLREGTWVHQTERGPDIEFTYRAVWESRGDQPRVELTGHTLVGETDEIETAIGDEWVIEWNNTEVCESDEHE